MLRAQAVPTFWIAASRPSSVRGICWEYCANDQIRNILPRVSGITQARQRRITTNETDQQRVQRLANEYEKASRKAEFMASTSAFGSMILGIATAACQLMSGRLVKMKS
jgi:hypothetical protein